MRRPLVIRAVLAVASLAALLSVPGAGAPPPVKIGVVLPLTGNAAVAGQSAKAAIEVGGAIVNEAHPEMANIPLAATAGLPNLGGAAIELIFADSQGNPSVGQSEALRLITQEKVVALEGAYQSAVTLPATTVAERQGIPWLVGDSSSANITGRGFKWIFRTTFVGWQIAKVYMEFLADVNKTGQPVKTVAIVNENTEYGTNTGGAILDAAKERGFQVIARIPYNANGADVSAEVLQLQQKNPDVVIFVSYTSDAILFMKTFKSLGYRPKMVMAEDAGFSDPAFVQNVGSISEGVVNRTAWSIGKPGSPTYRINEMYKAKTGRDLDDNSARNLQGFLALADAINRARSTQADAIRQALAATNLSPEQMVIGFKGVRFDNTGQNVLTSTYMTQLIGGRYVVVWPQPAAEHTLAWPFAGWSQ
jgi:branched-chain amino acid transport system substrate-binding protein